MNLEIQSWYGRFGNNIIQLCNVLWLAQKKRYNITYIPEHPQLEIHKINKRYLTISNYPGHKKTVKARFFKMKEVYNVLQTNQIKPTVTDYRRLLHNVIYNILKPDNKPLKSDILPTSTVVIHIRSGDCFVNNKPIPHPDYVPVPLSYYIKLFEDYQEEMEWDRIIIVTENDKLNPAIDGFEKYIASNYPNVSVRIQSSTIENDMKTLLSAQSLILSIGYFSKVLGLLSKNVKFIYCSDYLFECNDLLMIDGVKTHIYNITDYIPIGNWKDDTSQRGQILSHPLEKIVKL